MQKLFHKVEGWKTKDGRFHEKEDMARPHALRLILEEQITRDKVTVFSTEATDEIVAHAQWLYDIMCDLGYKASPKVEEAKFTPLSDNEPAWRRISARFEYLGVKNALVEDVTSAKKSQVNVYIYGQYDEEHVTNIALKNNAEAVVREIVPSYTNILVQFADMPVGHSGIIFKNLSSI